VTNLPQSSERLPKYHPVTFLNAVDAVDSIGVKMFHMDEADSLFERKDIWMY